MCLTTSWRLKCSTAMRADGASTVRCLDVRGQPTAAVRRAAGGRCTGVDPDAIFCLVRFQVRRPCRLHISLPAPPPLPPIPPASYLAQGTAKHFWPPDRRHVCVQVARANNVCAPHSPGRPVTPTCHLRSLVLLCLCPVATYHRSQRISILPASLLDACASALARGRACYAVTLRSVGSSAAGAQPEHGLVSALRQEALHCRVSRI